MEKSNSRRNFITKSALTAALAFTSLNNFGRELETAVQNAPLSSSPGDLKITDIKCGYIRNGHSLFVKIYTNQDIWGCGEAVDATPGTYHLVKMFGQRIKGKVH